MSINIRAYEDSDYQACEDLVDRTWQFSKSFTPEKFCAVAKYAYTAGSVLGSNHKSVIECDGRVVGFLFGYNEHRPLRFALLRQLILSLRVLKRLFFVKGMAPGEKGDFIEILNQHSRNRDQVEKRGASEIHLFAIDRVFRGQGIGTEILTRFVEDCRARGVKRVIVEVNVPQSAEFYAKCGFSMIREFASPLYQRAGGEGAVAALMERRLSD